MSTHREGHPTRKRQRSYSSPQRRHVPQQLRPLAPKGKAFCHPVQHRRRLGHSNIREQQPADPTNEVNLQQSDHAFSSVEREQYSAVARCPNIYPNKMPPTPASDGIPGPAPDKNLFTGVVTHESHSLSTYHLPYGNLQPQETIQSRHGEGYCIQMLNTPMDPVDPVWTEIVQSAFGIQGQYSIRFSGSMA